MNTFWLKVAGFAVVVAGLIILVNKFYTPKDEPKTEPKTFYDVIEQDDKRLRAEPETEYEQAPKTRQVAEKPKPKPQFEELALEDKARAEQLFEWALTQRKMGRLPGMGYKKMVDACREIIRKYPDSVYAYKARRMLGDIPRRYWKRYNITEQEINPAD